MSRLRTLPKIWANCRRLARATEAVAAVEFAVILPIMLLLYVGSQELSALITVDRRVTVVAGTVGDLVARTNTCLETTTLDDYFAAAQTIMGGLPTTSLEQVVTEVSVDGSGNATVVWSRAYNGGTAKTSGESFDLSSAMANITKNGYAIIAETWYSYTPLLGFVLPDVFHLYHSNYYVPRYDSAIAVRASCV